MVEILAVREEEAGQRLDRWFKHRFPALGHARLEKLLRTGQIRIDGKRAKAGARLEAGQSVRIPPLGAFISDDARPPDKGRDTISAADRNLIRQLVLYRDDEIIALNKPPGLAVQGGTGTERHIDGMLDALRFGSSERPRLVHRLDRDTSGVLLLGRTAAAAAKLAEAFRGKTTRKIYWAITVGVPRPLRGKVDISIAKHPGQGGERMMPDDEVGKHAVSYYSVVENLGRKAAWVALWPVTGRTHQLRVHMAEVGTPIQGDRKYGGSVAFLAGGGLSRKLHLHARAIALPHPRTGRPIIVTAPLPSHMQATWRLFGFDPNWSEDPFAALAD
ncbi:MAG TPA: RluA family pseudouridine synthase [Alphaproteobacteria bacterium]|nr:RluA family pseudouridine synthase [Alphaproteobacteria bacterium]